MTVIGEGCVMERKLAAVWDSLPTRRLLLRLRRRTKGIRRRRRTRRRRRRKVGGVGGVEGVMVLMMRALRSWEGPVCSGACADDGGCGGVLPADRLRSYAEDKSA